MKEAKGSEGEQRGAKGGKGEQREAKGSEAYCILGFRVPTTWNEKSSISTCSG